jgi:peptidoglycan/LPS O-acetylase OafA/YrhL
MPVKAVSTGYISSGPQLVFAKRRPFYCPQLDGLRFLAFMAVYFQHVFHAGPDFYLQWAVFKPLHLTPAMSSLLSRVTLVGGMGVDLFFALSSFLITSLLLREIQDKGNIHLSYFYARRILRIWPLYAAVLFVGIVLIPALHLGPTIPTPYIACFLLFAGNWICAFQGVPDALGAISPLWSISIEEQFYLFWPLVLYKYGTKYLTGICIGLIVTGEFSRLALCMMHAGNDLSYFNTFTHLDSIAWGALLALGTRQLSRCISLWQRGLLGTACLSIALFTLLYVDSSGGYITNLIAVPLYCASCAVVIFLAMQTKLLSLKPLPYLGRISFGLYAYHAMIIYLLDRVVAKGSWVKLLMIPIKLALTIVVAALSYRFLEAPILKLKETFTLIKSRPV